MPEDHLAYFVLDLLADKDLSALERVLQAKDARGERPFAPRMMLGLLVYGYSVGVFSSRTIERATHEDMAFRVLAGGDHPHFTTINESRLRHREAFAELFHQVLQDCMSAGLVKLGHVAIDGTKMKANASKHKAMSYDRMKKDEARLKAEIEQLVAQAEQTDAAEDAAHGVGQQPSDLPAELRRREAQYFEPVLRRVVDNCNAAPAAATADSGYWSAENVRAAEHLGTEPYISVGKHRNDGSQEDSPVVSPRLANLFTAERAAMRAKLDTDAGRAQYARRKATVEPVIGQIRTRGFQHFSMRGLLKVRCEWLLVAATHNILKLWRRIGQGGLARLATA